MARGARSIATTGQNGQGSETSDVHVSYSV